MSEQPISIEKIMNRIKTTLEQAKKNRKQLEKQELPLNHNYHLNYMKLSNDVEYNNRNWNVSPEYKLTSHRRTTGKFIVFGKKIIRKLLRWYINPAFEKQSTFNGSVTRSVNNISTILADLIRDVEYLSERSTKLDEIENELTKNRTETADIGTIEQNFVNQRLEQSLEAIENIIDTQKILEKRIESIDSIINNQEKLERDLETILINQHKIESNIEEINQRFASMLHSSTNYLDQDVFNDLKNKIFKDFNDINDKIEKIDDTILLLNSRIKKNVAVSNENIINEIPKETITLIPKASDIEINNKLDIDYFLFEQKFRGTRSVIMERQKEYLPFFTNRKEVLDIGCGRGEFIELLQKEHGIRVKGIDINSDMIGYCKERGFDVQLIDAIDYLGNIADNSLDGIFMAQVIEHLSSDQAMNLINSVYRVLKPGGLFIVETINVQSVFAMSNWFYMDPTHVKPVHPVTLKFIFQGFGYSQVDVKYLSPVPDKGIPHLHIEGVDLGQFNESLNDLNGLIYGYQDYAICAYK